MARESGNPRCDNCGHPNDRHMMEPGSGYDRNNAGQCNVGWDKGETHCDCKRYRRPRKVRQ